ANSSQATMRARIVSIECDGSFCGIERAFAIGVVLRYEAVYNFVIIGLGNGRMCRPQLRVDGYRTFEKLPRLHQILTRVPVEMDHAQLIDAPGVHALAVFDPGSFPFGPT